MGLEEGPNGPNYYEGETAIDEIERAALRAEIARKIESRMNEAAAIEIATDPQLEAMMAMLIERSLEWDPYRRNHLRRMIALRLATTNKLTLKAAQEAEFFEKVIDEISREVEELQNMPGLEDMPDPWDSAFADLLELYGENDSSTA